MNSNTGSDNITKPITIAALTAGVNTPSTRFRIRQYIPAFKELGITVSEYIPYFEKSCGLPSPFKAAARIPALFQSRSADLVWVGKELVQGHFTFECLLKRPRVLDVDDAIWNNFPFGRWASPAIARRMDAVVVGNEYLHEYFSKYNKNIHIIPTAIDLSRYTLRTIPETPPEVFNIGWTGSACNYKYMSLIESALARFLKDHPRSKLTLIANRPWTKHSLPHDQVHFIPWSPEIEATGLHDFSVGIMPLPDDHWSRGKCSFKMLQYMAVGLPVIVSPVGMNKQILEKGSLGFEATTESQWYDALETLYNDWQLQQTMGQVGRDVIERFYATDKVAMQLANIFHTIAGA